MMARVWAIAFNTYREAIRQKVLYGLVFFTIIIIMFSLFLGQLSLGADHKIVKDMGLASMMFLGALMSIFIGVGLVFKEIDRRTIYTILSKPVSRAEFVLGKFVGLTMTIGLEVVFMTLLLFFLLSFYAQGVDFSLLKAVFFIFMELCILVGVALVFSSYSSSFMSILFCLSFLVIGHLTDDLAMIMEPRAQAMIWKEGEAFSGYVLLGIVRVLEVFSLDHFSINSQVVHGVPVSWIVVLNTTLYWVSLLIIVLTLSIFLFRRKDLS